jgi:hypothetical protein
MTEGRRWTEKGMPHHTWAARGRRALPIVLVLAGVGLSACAEPPTAEPASDEKVATVEPIAGTDLSTVTLSSDAVRRLGVATDTVGEKTVRGLLRKVVPYAAVVYDAEGATFAYANPEPMVFRRVPLTIEFVEAQTAVLTDGPVSGTSVVTVGVAELLGTEYGVGGE